MFVCLIYLFPNTFTASLLLTCCSIVFVVVFILFLNTVLHFNVNKAIPLSTGLAWDYYDGHQKQVRSKGLQATERALG